MPARECAEPALPPEGPPREEAVPQTSDGPPYWIETLRSFSSEQPDLVSLDSLIRSLAATARVDTDHAGAHGEARDGVVAGNLTWRGSQFAAHFTARFEIDTARYRLTITPAADDLAAITEQDFIGCRIEIAADIHDGRIERASAGISLQPRANLDMSDPQVARGQIVGYATTTDPIRTTLRRQTLRLRAGRRIMATEELPPPPPLDMLPFRLWHELLRPCLTACPGALAGDEAATTRPLCRVFINGIAVPPPYTVIATEASVLINGREVYASTPASPATPLPPARARAAATAQAFRDAFWPSCRRWAQTLDAKEARSRALAFASEHPAVSQAEIRGDVLRVQFHGASRWTPFALDSTERSREDPNAANERFARAARSLRSDLERDGLLVADGGRLTVINGAHDLHERIQQRIEGTNTLEDRIQAILPLVGNETTVARILARYWSRR